MEANYGQQYRELYQRHWWWRARESYVLDRLRSIPRTTRDHDARRGARILDVGCGDGLMWNRLQELGEVEGIEPDPQLLAVDSPWRSRIEVADFPDGRPRDSHYDFVLMLDVLEHMEDHQAALERVRTLLAPTGHLLLTVPALPILWSEFDRLTGHFRRYTRASLRQVVEAAGLEVVDVRYYYFWPVLPLLARRVLFRADKAEGNRFIQTPPEALNRFLYLLSLADHRVTRLLPAPMGSSLIAVARRPRAT